MPLKIYNVSETAKKPYIKALVYGSPGVGKTTFAATAQKHPDMKNVLVVNVEGGLLSVASMPGIQAVDVSTSQELEELFWMLSNNDKAFEHIQTIVIDSGSEIQVKELENIAREKHRKSPGKRASIDELHIDDYGDMTKRLTRLFRWYKDLPNRHVIITALEKSVYPKVDTRKQNKEDVPPLAVYPNFTEKLGNNVMGYVDFCWYLYVDPQTGTRTLLTQPVGAYRAKTRGAKFSEALGVKVDSPDFGNIYNLLLETERGE